MQSHDPSQSSPAFDPRAVRRLESRSLALHRAIAARLRERPELLAQARATIARWQAQGRGSAHYLAQWQGVLDQGLEATLALLEAEGDYAHTMRSCTPFTGILTPRERWAIHAAHRP